MAKIGIRRGEPVGSKLGNKMGKAVLVRNLIHGAGEVHVHKHVIGVVIFRMPTTATLPATPSTHVRLLTFNPRNALRQCQPRG